MAASFSGDGNQHFIGDVAYWHIADMASTYSKSAYGNKATLARSNRPPLGVRRSVTCHYANSIPISERQWSRSRCS